MSRDKRFVDDADNMEFRFITPGGDDKKPDDKDKEEQDRLKQKQKEQNDKDRQKQ